MLSGGSTRGRRPRDEREPFPIDPTERHAVRCPRDIPPSRRIAEIFGTGDSPSEGAHQASPNSEKAVRGVIGPFLFAVIVLALTVMVGA